MIYTIPQWILLFYIYCFFGWCFESVYVSICLKKWVNRGFLRAPMLPIYGSGALCILIVCLPVKNNPIAVFILGIIFPTILEYVTGWAMERMFKMKYWDYSDKKYNLNGYICLTSSLAWGALSLIMVNFIHPPIGRLVEHIPTLILWILVVVISCVFVSDCIVSFRAAFDLSRVLQEMERVRTQIEETRVQLELARAEARDFIEDISQDIREENQRRQREMEVRMKELRSDFRTRMEKQNKFLVRAMLKAHPSATSRRFAGSLKQLRETLSKKK